ncbi:MAG: TIGR00730 family Rossman fold protein [Paludibacter sp.]
MKIAVYCSSSNHIPEKYKLSAFRLGELIAESGNTLVYGGATGGLMDSVAEGAFSKNGNIIGVIANAIVRMNRQSALPSQLITVETLSQRKDEMKSLADVFVALPGSYGTLDETLDVITSGIVGEHKKPLILVNQDGFYNHFLAQIDLMRSELFIPIDERYKPIIVQDISQCFDNIIQFNNQK